MLDNINDRYEMQLHANAFYHTMYLDDLIMILEEKRYLLMFAPETYKRLYRPIN